MAAPGWMRCAATGRCRFLGCTRSLSASATSLMAYTPLASMQNMAKAANADATAESLALAGSDSPNLFLTDIRNAEIELSVTDLYELPGEWHSAGFRKWNRLAIVGNIDGSQQNKIAFFIAVCQNRGWQAKDFTDRHKAIHWLKDNAVSNQLFAGAGA